MVEIERLVVAGAAVRGAKFFRPCPGLEARLALPHGVRSIERVIFVLRALEQMEFDEARHLLQMRVAARPHVLEILLASLLHAEAIHRDEHRLFSFLYAVWGHGALDLHHTLKDGVRRAAAAGETHSLY